MPNKRSELRKEMRRVMAGLDDRWLRVASHELARQLEKLVEGEMGFCIRSILAWTRFFAGEVDLSAFISGQVEKRSVYLPRTLPDYSMDFISIGRDWGESISDGMYGIPEPGEESGKKFAADHAGQSCVLVPGQAFDKAGHRLGRGKGYYDRFLGMQEMNRAVKIGICWSLQLVEKVPTESHDIGMDWICHERGFLRVGE